MTKYLLFLITLVAVISVIPVEATPIAGEYNRHWGHKISGHGHFSSHTNTRTVTTTIIFTEPENTGTQTEIESSFNTFTSLGLDGDSVSETGTEIVHSGTKTISDPVEGTNTEIVGAIANITEDEPWNSEVGTKTETPFDPIGPLGNEGHSVVDDLENIIKPWFEFKNNEYSTEVEAIVTQVMPEYDEGEDDSNDERLDSQAVEVSKIWEQWPTPMSVDNIPTSLPTDILSESDEDITGKVGSLVSDGNSNKNNIPKDVYDIPIPIYVTTGTIYVPEPTTTSHTDIEMNVGASLPLPSDIADVINEIGNVLSSTVNSPQTTEETSTYAYI